MNVAASGIGLPDFNQSVPELRGRPRPNLSMHEDTLTDRLAFALPSQVIVRGCTESCP